MNPVGCSGDSQASRDAQAELVSLTRHRGAGSSYPRLGRLVVWYERLYESGRRDGRTGSATMIHIDYPSCLQDMALCRALLIHDHIDCITVAHTIPAEDFLFAQ